MDKKQARSFVALAFFALAAIACQDSTGPRLGYVRLSVQSNGGDYDNLFEITSDTIHLPIVANSISTLQLPAGLRSFELKGVADNCIVQGSSSTSVEIPRNDTVEVTFVVGCAVTGISIETRTTGQELPSQFEVLISSLPTVTITVNGTQTYGRLPVGRYDVRLRVGAPHCSVTGDSAVTADVVNRQVTAVIFNVRCVLTPLTGVIVFEENARLILMNADGSGRGDLTHGWGPSWSRDGTKIVYSTTECDYYSYLCYGSLATVDPATRQITLLSEARVGVQPDWSPTDDVIAYTDLNTAQLYLFNLANSATTLVPLPQGVIAFHPSWSPDGIQLVASCYVTGGPSRLCIMNRDGSGFRYLDAGANSNAYEPSWSPDGRQIVFTTAAAQTTISVINPDGTGLRNLVLGYTPSFSPDSRQIIFAWGNGLAGGNGLFVINADGSTTPTRITNGNHYFPAWRP